ncbi:MAG TPA: ankyrin repeat domain-containing protein [Pirellulales bacterium]|nr:ankyrin repeat domain-containing protein [Pirellulales bacterium]
MVKTNEKIRDEDRRQTLLEQDELDRKLLQAAFDDDIRAAKAALKDGARVWARGEDGEQALHEAVGGNDVSFVKMLLDAGADVNAKDHYDNTPLHDAAVASNKGDVAKILIDAGAKLTARNKHGKTPLDDAVAHGKSEVAKVIEDAIAARKAGKDFRTRAKPRKDQGRER